MEELARSATHTQDALRTAAAFAAALAVGGRHTWAFRIHRLDDGALQHLSSTVEVVLDDVGLPVQVRGVHQDVTDPVEAEQTALRANERFERSARQSRLHHRHRPHHRQRHLRGTRQAGSVSSRPAAPARCELDEAVERLEQLYAQLPPRACRGLCEHS